MVDITATTELEAVNLMLASIGESPVASLDDGLVDVEMARDLLRQRSKSVQMKGWGFNTLFEYTLTPDNNGYLNLPANCLKVFVPYYRQHQKRGSKLYDNIKHTNVYTADLKVTMVLGLPYDDLPESLRIYLYMAAGRVFQDQSSAESTLHQISLADETRAKADFWNEMSDEEQFNVVEQSPTIVGIKGRNR